MHRHAVTLTLPTDTVALLSVINYYLNYLVRAIAYAVTLTLNRHCFYS